MYLDEQDAEDTPTFFLKKDIVLSLSSSRLHTPTGNTRKSSVISLRIFIVFVQIRCKLLPMIKLASRGPSCGADASLTPVLREYLDGFFEISDKKMGRGSPEIPKVEFMGSDGGLLDLNDLSAPLMVLSHSLRRAGIRRTRSYRVSKRCLSSCRADYMRYRIDVGGNSANVSR